MEYWHIWYGWKLDITTPGYTSFICVALNLIVVAMLTISNFSHVIQEYSSIFSSEITLVYCSGTEAKSPLFHLVPGGLQSLQQPGQQLFCQRGVWSNLNQNPTSLKTKGIKLPYTSSLYQV